MLAHSKANIAVVEAKLQISKARWLGLSFPSAVILLAEGIAFLFQGCATTDQQALMDEINQKPVAASSLKALTYEPMDLGERSGLGFGRRKTSVFDFPEGKAYFKAPSFGQAVFSRRPCIYGARANGGEGPCDYGSQGSDSRRL